VNIKQVTLSLAILTLLIACANNSNSGSQMSTSRESIPATEEKLGLNRVAGKLVFRLYAPTVKNVDIVLFENHDDSNGEHIAMTPKANGVWELVLDESLTTPYYAYQSSSNSDKFIADPYSKAVVRQNNFRYPSKSVIIPGETFNWEGDTFTQAALGDLIILEAHVRDMTAHKSSGSTQPGTYTGFIEEDQKGGLTHLKDMGYNAVEFLPIQEFGNIEIDFKNPDLGIWNDWNPYENNHWGYMTSFFFAPEIYYGSDGVKDRDVWTGQDGRAVNELKEMVKELHQNGISVIMDVVYNHVSQYDENSFKLLDKSYYFRLNESGDYLSHSGCGNDFKTENPMSRKMIVESLVYWMEEYHIDGFRFDLATMIDIETVDAISAATRAVNPAVLLIGEPWGGGGYNPAELADHEWASWNDHFRNSIKGRHPRTNDLGFIFGKLWDGNGTEHYKKLMRGYLQNEGGHYIEPTQSVNYLESHDDNTLGDFVRLALGNVGHTEKVTRDQVSQLSAEELKIHKFAALNLLVSQGPVMIAQGQSWARSKVIANSIGSDPRAGQLDHNSYEKDDETNWLNWDEKALNQELVGYYRGLIAIRTEYSEIRTVKTEFRTFIDGEDDLSFGISMAGDRQVLVFLNANKTIAAHFNLPEGDWTILADAEAVTVEGRGTLKNSAEVAPQSGLILVQ